MFASFGMKKENRNYFPDGEKAFEKILIQEKMSKAFCCASKQLWY
jgi:hypothetical protein